MNTTTNNNISNPTGNNNNMNGNSSPDSIFDEFCRIASVPGNIPAV